MCVRLAATAIWDPTSPPPAPQELLTPTRGLSLRLTARPVPRGITAQGLTQGQGQMDFQMRLGNVCQDIIVTEEQLLPTKTSPLKATTP